MGRTTVTIDVINTVDQNNAETGLIAAHEVRHEPVLFIVDTGATFVSLPIDVIERLGLREIGHSTVMTANGVVERRRFSPVFIEIMGRQTNVDVMELPTGVPALLGCIPLEALDLVVNPRLQRLEGNPDHGGKYIHEQL